MKKIAFAAAALAAVAATPAFAQDAKTVSVFVGPVVGYDHINLRDGTDSVSDDGVMYGINAGADFKLGTTAFVGLEGEFSDSNVGESVSDIDTAGDVAKLEAGRTFYAGARLGADFSGYKVYLKGGYSNLRIKGSYNDTVDTYSVSDDLDGWVIGAGAEAKLNPVLLRVEYRYADYNDIQVLGVDTGVDATRHQVVASALFSF